jgi:hypothetical protein
MTESIEHGTWTWHAVMHDLEVQGEYPGVTVEPFSVSLNSCLGTTPLGNRFATSWAKDSLLMISMKTDEPELIEAFAKVVEYRPFCSYIDQNGMITYEWDKIDPDGRLLELQGSKVITDLKHLT